MCMYYVDRQHILTRWVLWIGVIWSNSKAIASEFLENNEVMLLAVECDRDQNQVICTAHMQRKE